MPRLSVNDRCITALLLLPYAARKITTRSRVFATHTSQALVCEYGHQHPSMPLDMYVLRESCARPIVQHASRYPAHMHTHAHQFKRQQLCLNDPWATHERVKCRYEGARWRCTRNEREHLQPARPANRDNLIHPLRRIVRTRYSYIIAECIKGDRKVHGQDRTGF